MGWTSGLAACKLTPARQKPATTCTNGAAAVRGAAAAPVAHPLPPFALERFFAKYEFSTKWQLCNSDTEPLAMSELLQAADADSLERWDTLHLAYTETQGLPELREAVATRLYSSVRPEETVVAAPQELIYLCMLALCKPGDHIVVTRPGYQSLYSIAESLGCEISYWEPTCAPNSGELSFNMGTLLAVMREDTKLVVCNFPHNPTGFLPTQQQWHQLIEACRSCGAYLFSDEMYQGLEFDPAARLPGAVDAYPERGISLCGCSKSVGLPGIRIGWLATHDSAVVSRVLELKDYTSICSSAPSEVLALMALRRWDELQARQMSICRANVGLLHHFMGRWGHVFRWQLPSSAPMSFPELLTGQPVAQFCEKLVEEAGVLLMPSTVYGHPGSVDQGRFRLGFGRRSMARCLEHLDAYLLEHYPN